MRNVFPTKISASRKRISTSRNEIFASRNEISASRSDTEAFRKEISAFRKKIFASRREKDGFRNDTEASRKKIFVSRKEISAFRKEISASRKRIFAVRKARNGLFSVRNSFPGRFSYDFRSRFTFPEQRIVFRGHNPATAERFLTPAVVPARRPPEKPCQSRPPRLFLPHSRQVR